MWLDDEAEEEFEPRLILTRRDAQRIAVVGHGQPMWTASQFTFFTGNKAHEQMRNRWRVQ